MRSVLIFNPGSGASILADRRQEPEEGEAAILAALNSVGITPEVWHTTPEEHGNSLARRAAREGAQLVIAAGGDGTLHAVASGLIDTSCAIGILPMGTMNNIARSLGIPEDLEQACAIIAHGETRRVDVGEANGKVFLEVVGIGLEAALFPAAEDLKRPGCLSTIYGIIAGLITLFTFKSLHFRASFDGKRRQSFHALQISVCNTPYYGARLQFAPNAIMNDGLLDVLIYKNFSKLEYLRHAISISQGRRVLEPKLKRRRLKSLYITSIEPVDVHADGVPQGFTPTTIRVVPGALYVRVPPGVVEVSPGSIRKPKKSKYGKREDNHVRQQVANK